MQVFKDIFENRHEYARAWKARTGGKVVGYLETYFPEEIAYAAGMLPVRVMPKNELDDVSDGHIYGGCYIARDIINLIAKNRYDYMDAFVCMEGCQWMYHAFESSLREKPELTNYYHYMPDFTDAPTSKLVMRSEMHFFLKKVEEWTGRTITDADLDRAIEVYNRHRTLLRTIYELRRELRPKIHGAEAMEIMLACQVMDKAEANGLLEKAIREIEAREPGEDRIRLILIGSETFDTRLEEIVEELGGDIVTDELDNGTSYCWNQVYPLSDRLLALAMRYLGRPHSALKDNNHRRRPQHIFELCEDFGVDGAIVQKQIYCHPHGTDNYAVWKCLREKYIPFHFFERDTTTPYQETRLRMQAFLNMLRPGLNHLRGWSTPELARIDKEVRGLAR